MKNYRVAILLMLGAIISALLLSACGLLESPGASARTPEEAITEAVRDSLDEQGAPISQMEVQIRQIEGDYARVEIISTDPESPGGFNAFMKREDGVWTIVASGSGMEKEHVESLGIPESVWPEGWLIPDSVSEPPADPNAEIEEAALLGLESIGWDIAGFSAEIGAVEGNFAFVTIHSTNPPGGFGTYLQKINGQWQVAVHGSGVNPDELMKLGFPSSMIPTTSPTGPETSTGCPTPTDGSLLLTDEGRGYCLLYPTSHTVVQLDSGNTEIVVGEVMNHIDPRVSITVEDLAGRTIDQVVDEFLAGYEGFEIERTNLTVAGEEAILLDGIPGQDFYRMVLVTHDGILYRLQFAPYDENLADTFPQAEQLYALVVDSFQFITE